MEGGSEGPERVSRRFVALERCTALLQLPHHGRVGDAVHRADDRRGIPVVAPEIVRLPLALVDSDAGSAISLHCQHGGLDYRGDRTSALAGIWTDANCGWLLQTRLGGKWDVHAARFYGDVYSAEHLLSVPGPPGN